VCDYDLPDVGDPTATVPPAPTVRAAGPAVIVTAEPRAVIELRTGGEVVAEQTASPGGWATFTHVPAGTYVLRQVVDDAPGLRTVPVTIG
jgi:hypothetical protein